MALTNRRVDTTVNPDEAVTNREVVKKEEEKEDRVKKGFVILPEEDPTFLSAEVQSCVSTLGSYRDCPVCGKTFYIQPGCESKWVYRLKGNSNHGAGRHVCSYSCSRKGNQ
jgi:hypothetical protein